MKSIAQINSARIIEALEKAKPLTMAGRSAVANYRQFLANNALSAIALESSINTLSSKHNMDPGLIDLITVLRGIMHTSKRKVAVAYERLQLEIKGSFLAAGVEADTALAELYEHNAAQIIGKINEGALNAWSSNPTIANLINWAKTADKNRTTAGLPSTTSKSGIKGTLVPILTIAKLADDRELVSMDNETFIRGKNGTYSYLASASTLDSIPNDVKVILHCLTVMSISDSQPNVLKVDDEAVALLKKALNIKSFAIDLMAGINDMVIMNGIAMSTEKAKALMTMAKDEVIANMLLDAEAKDALKLLTTIMDVFEKYRGSFITQSYAKKFVDGTDAFYVAKENDRYAMVVKINGSVVSTTSYANVYDMLADEMLIGNPGWHDAVSVAYANDLQNETKNISVRKKLLVKLTEERKSYEDLLKKIKLESKDLSEALDANPEKVKALDKLTSEVSEKITTVNDEIAKLSK